MFNKQKFLADSIEVPVVDLAKWLICKKSMDGNSNKMLEDADAVTLLGIVMFPLKLAISLITIGVVVLADLFIALSCIEFKMCPRRKGR